MKNLYEVLGLTQEATTSDIKKAYLKLALIAHPDKGGSKELMTSVNIAYSTLSDPVQRRQYDANFLAFKTADVDSEENILIDGLLPAGITPPYSQVFKKIHLKLRAKFEQEPLQSNAYLNSLPFKSELYQYEDQEGNTERIDNIFELIRKNEMYSSTKWIPFHESKLTITIAIALLNNFLSGNYYGYKLVEIRKYLLSEINALQLNNPQQPIIQFYEGILELFLMTDKDYSEHGKLLFSVKKITDYSKNAPENQLVQITPLFYNKFFRNLHAYALHCYWLSKGDLFEPRYLDKFDGTQGAKELLEIYKNKLLENQHSDDLLLLIRYIKLLYKFDKEYSSSSNSEITAADCRINAFHFLDWIPTFLETSSKEIIANVFLQIGIKFQQASRLETQPELIVADEQLAIKMYTTALALVKDKTPDVEMYINTIVLKHLSHFQFQDPLLIDIFNALKKKILLLADIFPFFESYQSNIDLFNQENKMLHLMRRLLHTMIDIHEHNKSHTQSINIDQSVVTILYQAYEACLKNWYQEHYNPELEQKFRLELMDELLFNNGWIFLDVEQNIDSPYIMVDRDEQGWIKPSRSLPFGEDAEVIKYKSINGVEINKKTGEINFFLTPWNQNLPESDKVFTQFDLQDMLEKNIGGAIFSLDPADPDKPYHPFNLMRFAPPELDESELLNTMLLTDYILKFLTTTQEVQGQYPFEQRSVAALIGHMPEYLQKIITDFHQAPHTGAIHRFWIEAEEITVPISEQNNEDTIRIGVNELKMVVKKHRMERDIHGQLKDVGNEDEGWPIYVLTEEQIHELKQGLRTIKGSAMVFTHAQAKLLYWEHNSELQTHIPKDCRETLIRLYLQPRDEHGKIAVNTKNMPLIYKITNEMARQSGLATRYSPEFIFAHEFTAHYDEFAQYLPEFGRLKQLSKMTIVVSFLKNLRKSNQERLTALDFLINPAFSSPPQTDAFQNLKQVQDNICEHTIAQFVEWRKELASSVLEIKCMESAKKIKTTIGQLSFTSSSSEVTEACEQWSKQIAKDNPSATSKQIWAVINPQKDTIAKQLTDNAQANCKKALQQLLSNPTPPGLDFIITSFIQGTITPLKNALVKREQNDIEKQLVKQFPHSKGCDLMSALEGSDEAVLVIANKEVLRYFEEEKKSCELAEIGYSNIGLGKQKEPVDLEGKCFWVPACVCHQPSVGTSRHSFFVYGGVNINPRVNVVPGGNGPLRGNQVGGGAFNRAQITKGFQSHHIISPTNSATKNHRLLELAGFNNKRDMNSQVNRIYLPTKREYNPGTAERPGRSLHNGRHTQAAMNLVADQMTKLLEKGRAQNWSQTQYRAELRTMLVENRQNLRFGKTDLYVNPRVSNKRG